jgi:hypothetical protein
VRETATRKPLGRRTTFLIGAIGGALVAAAAAALAASQMIGAGGVIQACYRVSEDDRKGELRAVNDASACRSNELPISWNIQGAKGDKGNAGPQGIQGPAGSQGPSGTSGLREQSCADGHFVTGFDSDGRMVCRAPGSPSEDGGGPGGEPDTDQDGIPDASDPCPLVQTQVFEFEGMSYCRVTRPYVIVRGLFPTRTRLALTDMSVVRVIDATTIEVGVVEGDAAWEGPDGSSVRVSLPPGAVSPPVATQVIVYGTLAGDGAFAAAFLVIP